VIRRLAALRLTRTEQVALLVVAVLAALGGSLAPLFLSGGGGPALLARGHDAAIVLADLSPERPSFADAVEATLTVAVDRRRVDVGTVKPLVELDPYRITAVRRSVSGGGAATLVRYRFQLECVQAACLPGAPVRFVSLPDPVAVYVGSDRRVHELRGSWPPLHLRTRLDGLDQGAIKLGRPPFAVQLDALTGTRYARDPGLLAALLVAAAALLVLCAALVLARPLLRRRGAGLALGEPLPAGEPEPVAQALGVLEAACAPPRPDERPHALDLLARALDARGEPELAREARLLAWSREEIDDDELVTLSARCQALLAGEEACR